MVAKEPKNLLTLIPEKNREWHKTETGRAKILVPRYGQNPVGAWLARRLANPYIQIELDDVGTAVWEACDGKTTVAEIAENLSVRFGDRVEPLYDRLAIFFQQLQRNKFIRWGSDVP